MDLHVRACTCTSCTMYIILHTRPHISHICNAGCSLTTSTWTLWQPARPPAHFTFSCHRTERNCCCSQGPLPSPSTRVWLRLCRDKATKSSTHNQEEKICAPPEQEGTVTHNYELAWSTCVSMSSTKAQAGEQLCRMWENSV